MPLPAEISNRSDLGHVMSTPDDPIVIDTQGDLLLFVRYSKELSQYYRVSVSVLRNQSSYFDNLLSTKFSEGIAVDSRLATLRKCHEAIACVPPSALPMVTVSDIAIGPADTRTDLCESSLGLLLEILHGCLQWSIVKTKGYVRPIILALLAHYAEAFAAIPSVSKEIHALSEKGYIRGNARPTIDIKEEKSRQKIYAGLILDLPDWLYTSRQTQCKLSYDSSPQCDSFQLGEMVRFFTRKGTVKLQSALSGTYQESEPFQGHLLKLLQSLKECPSYQLDGFHRHCGLRTRFIPRLETVDPWGHAGLCLHCWKKERGKHSWVENPNQEHWGYAANNSMPRCAHGQLIAKAMYTSPCPDWTINETLAPRR
ncbi:MAG: hypothetical protein Q9169_001411 [Polycauliona sp. 2 TL-2023]